MMETIPLRWVKNDVTGAEFAFDQKDDGFYYLGAPIRTDFPMSYEALAPYVTAVLDLAAPLEGAGVSVALVEIKAGVVKVW